MTTTHTREEIDAALDQAIADRGEDYVYPAALTGGTCMYSNPDGTPSCGVGYVIAALDPDAFEKIVEFEAYNEGSTGATELFGGQFVGEYGDTPVFADQPFTEQRLASALQVFQSAQDQGLTWGQARELYTEFLENEEYDDYNWNGFNRSFVDPLAEAAKAAREEAAA